MAAARLPDGASLRLVHRRFRHARSDGGQGHAARVSVSRVGGGQERQIACVSIKENSLEGKRTPRVLNCTITHSRPFLDGSLSHSLRSKSRTNLSWWTFSPTNIVSSRICQSTPTDRVPTLEEDGFVLFESTAILDYLEATRPTPPMAPSDARGRALVDMHMKLCDLQFSRYAVTIIFPKRFLPKEHWNVAAMADAKVESESIWQSSTSTLRERLTW
jgi:Glutathione S-transferase, N-terminal domain